MKIRGAREPEKGQLNMTSMIDVVFLLLIFFVMTFKIVELEGDFGVRMPLASDSPSVVDPTDVPLQLRLQADGSGNLQSISLNDQGMGVGVEGYNRLRAEIVRIIGATAPVEGDEGPEIEIEADYNLRYEYTIRAFTAVSGYKDGQRIVPLIDRIKFAEPKR